MITFFKSRRRIERIYMKFKAVIFDMDGTLTVPMLEFGLIRREAGLPPEGDIISILGSLSEEKRRFAWKVIEQYENVALDKMMLQEGVLDALEHFRKRKIRLGLLTRNSPKSVKAFIDKLGFEFDSVITRDYPHLKPRPEPVLHMLEAWSLQPEDALVVGDYIHDIECGRAAGAKTCFFANPGRTSYAEFADYSVSSFDELLKIIKQ